MNAIGKLPLRALFVFLTLSSLLQAAQSQTCAIPPNGLISWWTGDGTANDLRGTNHGTIVGSTAYVSGKVGQAFRFRSSGDSVALGNPSGLQLQNLTIEAWIKQNTPVPASAGSGYILGYSWYDGYAFAVDSQGRLIFSKVGRDGVLSAARITDTNYHHVAVTRTNSTVVFYIDGVAEVAPAYNPTFLFTSDIGIGARADTTYGFPGEIDEIAVYNRALNGAEIQAIYAAGAAGKCTSAQNTNSPPSILAQPSSQTIVSGDDVTFSVVAQSYSPIFYQWRLEGTNIVAATNSSYTIHQVTGSDAGVYSAVVRNTNGFTLSSNAVLTVVPQPACVTLSNGLVSWWTGDGTSADNYGTNHGTSLGSTTYVSGKVGQAFRFQAGGTGVALGNPTSLQLQNFSIEAWIKQNTPVSPSADSGYLLGYSWYDGYAFAVNSEGRLIFSKVGRDGVLSNAKITDTSYHHVAVTRTNSVVVFYIDGVAEVAPPYNPTFEFTSDIGIGARTDTTYGFPGDIDEIAIYNRALSANEIQAIYNARTSGRCKSVPPSIFEQPASQTAEIGETVIFQVGASGSTPFAYQWQFNGTNIPGATNTTLQLQSVTTNEAGVYNVQVTNPNGSAMSSNAVLEVVSVRPCSQPAAGLVSWWSGDGTPNDLAGTNHGSLFGLTSYVPGKVGQAFNFRSSGDSVAIGNPASLQLQNLSIEAWIKQNTPVPASANSGYLLGYSWYDGYAFGVDSQGRLIFSKVGRDGVLSTARITDTNYHHVAVTRTNSTVVFYIDGVAEVTSPYNPTFEFTSDIGIGGRTDGSYGFPGEIDEIAIYNRALSGSEIQSIYNAKASGKCKSNPPSIVQQPQSQSVPVGESATFSVTAAGIGPLSFQWRLNGTNIASATASTLTILNVSNNDAGDYSVVASNPNGSITSSNATLTVTPPPPCVAPASGLVAWWPGEGDASDIAGTNHGSLQGNMSFSTGKAGQAFDFNGTNAHILVPSSSALNVRSFTFETWIFARDYAARPVMEYASSNSYAGVDLWINLTYGASLPGAIFANVRDSGFGNHWFSSGAGVLVTNQWQHLALTYDSNNGEAKIYLNGAVVTQSNLGTNFLPATALPLNIGYRPIGSGDPGGGTRFFGKMDEISIYNRALSSNEIASIFNASSSGKCSSVAILTQPAGQTVYAGNTASFNVVAAGRAPLSFQWQFNGTDIIGATGSSLTLANVQPEQAGNYSVVVSNVDGSITSSNAQLTVNVLVPPSVTTPPQSQTVAVGANVTFAVTATGTQPLAYQWLFNSAPISSATSSTLTLNNVQTSASGNYSVVITNIAGSATTSVAVLTVVIPPTILSQPVSQIAPIHSGVTFTLLASGSEPLSYQWFFNGQSLPGATDASLTLNDLMPFNAGSYQAIVSNSGGSSTSTVATLVVKVTAADFNGDGATDIIWRNTNGVLAVWLMNGTNLSQIVLLRNGQPVDPAWRLAGFGDLNGDGRTDFVWQRKDNLLAAWLMNGTNITVVPLHGGLPVSDGWNLAGLADFNSDGQTDFLWQHTDGRLAVWFMDGTTQTGTFILRNGQRVAAGWQVAALADFNDDGQKDLVWQHTNGLLAVWLRNGTTVSSVVSLNNGQPAGSGWRIAGAADLSGDDRPDLLWQNTNGISAVWFMNGTAHTGTVLLNGGKPAGAGWKLIGPK